MPSVETVTALLPLLAGLGTGLALIVAIGVQNTYLLRLAVSARLRVVAAAVLVCAVSDAVLILAGVLGVAYDLGIRVNVQTGSVTAPAAAASPDEVVRAYVEAYNHRDFATMATIYPSGQGAYSRYRAMGTMRNSEITRSQTLNASDMAGMFPKAGYHYRRVEVSYRWTGLTGSDLAYEAGSHGSIYWLERSSDSEPWTISDEGF